MTSPEFWAASKRPVKQKDDTPKRLSGRVWTLRHGQHRADLDLRLIDGYGAEIVLSVNGELRRGRLYHRTRVLAMLDAIVLTESRFVDWLA
jgi:hypothetical protein